MEKTIGEQLKIFRKLCGYTLRNVELNTGISNPYLSQLENNKIVNPGFFTVLTLCTYYQIELTDLDVNVTPCTTK